MENNQNWISLKDGLPDRCGMSVLLVVENTYGQKQVISGFTGYMESGKLDFHSYECDLSSWTVTHWNPFPELPQ